MFERIMIPVDLVHASAQHWTLAVAAALAGPSGAELHLVGIVPAVPSEVARSPAEYREKFDAFAAERGAELGVPFRSTVFESHGPATDLDRHLSDAVRELDADLVVMASHVPRFDDWFVRSHARWLADHTGCSMFIVR